MTFVRFFGLGIGSVLALAMALLTVRFWGMGQKYIAYDNRFLQSAGEQKILPWEALSSTPREVDHNQIIFWLKIYRNNKGNLLVAPSAKEITKDDRDLGASRERPLLETLLAQYPKQRLLVDIKDNAQDIHLQLKEVLDRVEGPRLSEERLMIQSSYDTVLISIKEIYPRLVYGSTLIDNMRLKSYDSLWVLPAAPFKGDVLVSPLYLTPASATAGKVDALNEDIVQEMHHRKKLVFVGPLMSNSDAELALRLGADGLIFSNADWAWQWLKDHR